MTLVIYSGVPDPTWSVHPRHDSFKTMKEHLYHARTTGKIYRHQDMPAILGYKGFLVHPPQAEEAELVVGQETKELQKLLLETMPEELISQALRQKILQPRWNQQAFLILQVHILVNPKRLLSKR